MKETRCPAEEQLSSFVQGQLNESQMEQLSDHVEHCSACEQTLRGLETIADGVISQLREPYSENRFAEEAAFQQRIAIVKAIGKEGSETSRDFESRPPEGLEQLPSLREYQLLGQLGQGGMGTVYKAIHTRLGKTVAIKFIAHGNVANAAAIHRFSQEMKAVGQLEHPNLIRAHDAGEVEGRHFLVMEYLEGIDLSQLVRSLGPLPIAEACELIRQASSGMQFVHQLGLVHRDIKPSNLMLTSQGQVKVLDLGLAVLSQTDCPARESTVVGQIDGTIEYMAPEQAGNTHQVDIRADVYSLGATLYKLLTGEAPFADSSCQTAIQKLTALTTREPMPITQRRSDLPTALVAVIHRMLAIDPSMRFGSPAEVARALQPFAARADLSSLTSRPHSDRSDVRRDVKDQLTHSELPCDQKVNLIPDKMSSRSLMWRMAGGAGIIALAVIVLFWRSPKGMIRIEINDDQIRAQFDRDGLTVTGVDQLRINVGNGDNEIESGTHRLVVQRGDIKIETDPFEVNRNGQTVLKIELVKDSVQVTANGRTVDITPVLQIPSNITQHSTNGTVERSPPTLDAAWFEKVESLNPEEQIGEVLAEIRRRNPRFDGQSAHRIDSGRVTEFKILADYVADISPVRAFRDLQVFDCAGSRPRYGVLNSLVTLSGMRIQQLNVSNTRVSVLSPLSGMPLSRLQCACTRVSDLTPLQNTKLTILNCSDSRVSDLSPLKDLPLINLACSDTQVVDLSPLSTMKLIALGCSNTAVSDLRPLKGMKLTDLYISNTHITDLSPLMGMPLRAVKLDIKSQRDSEIMQDIDTLNAINDLPASQFWASRDANPGVK